MTLYSAFGTHGNAANGPGASSSYSGSWLAGLAFKVTSSGYYLQQYGYWRADSSQTAAPQFALWIQTTATAGTYQAGTLTSMSGATAGAWNYVSLATPFLLSTGTVYKIVGGWSNNFSETKNQFGTAGAYIGGIVNGPLTVYSSTVSDGGTNAIPFGNAYQGVFSTAGTDPSANLPASTDSDANFWIDLVIGPAAVAVAPAPSLLVRAKASPRPGMFYVRS